MPFLQAAPSTLVSPFSCHTVSKHPLGQTTQVNSIFFM